MHRKAGFTLIEVLVALTLGAILVLAAHAAFGGAADVAGALGRDRAAHDAEMAGRVWLVRAVGSLEPVSPGAVGFDGSPDHARFSTRLRAADGRFALTTVRLHAADGWLVASPDSGSTLHLLAVSASSRPPVTFDYLLSTGADSRWVQGWQSPVSAPVAIRIRLVRVDGRADTMLLSIGPRG